jgi:hypothetical protein
MPEEILTEIGGEGAAGGAEAGGEGGGGAEGEEQDPTAGGGEGGEGGGEGEGGQPAPKPGTYTPKQFKEHLAKLNEIDPAIAKAFSRAYYKVANVDKLGSTQELQTYKDTIEAHGGLEGIAGMAEEVEASRQLEEGFKAGDPKIIDGWAKDYPDGFKKLLIPAFDRLESMDGPAWEQQAGTVSTKFLTKFGVFDAVGQLGAALKDNKVEDAVRLYNDLVSKVLKPMQNLAQKALNDPLAGDRQKLEQERQELLTREQKMFYGGVRQIVNAQVTGLINKELRTVLGDKRLEVNLGNRLRKAINEELSIKTNSMPNYSRQYKAMMSGGDQEKAAKFILTNASKNLTAVVRQVVKEFGLTAGRGGTGGAGGSTTRRAATPNGQPQTIVGKPKAGDVDWTRTDKSVWILPKGQAYLKNGKIAKWG